MNEMAWKEIVDKVRPHVVRISTQYGRGTGFLVARSEMTEIVGVATAAHVIDDCHNWELPIRIEHLESKKKRLLRVDDRAIFLDKAKDTAAIVFTNDKDVIGFPQQTLKLIPKDKYTRVGVEVGWLGYPAVSHRNLCFFSGRISCYRAERRSYLVDGVVINGVSGGPTFRISGSEPAVMGVVSAYIVNRATGETLPGLSVVSNVVQLHDVIAELKSLDQAKEEQTIQGEPTPSPTEEDA